MEMIFMFILLICFALVISMYGMTLVVVCTILGVYDKQQDTDFRAVKGIWGFIIATFMFYWFGKLLYWVATL